MIPSGAFIAASGARTVAEWLAKAASILAERGVEEAQANAELLLSAVLGCSRPQLHAMPSRPLSLKESRHFRQLIMDRSHRVPLAYVLGTQAFLDLEIRVAPGVLIPRPETEGLVEAAVELAGSRLPSGPLHVVEIGTGSGCVCIAMARRLPQAILYATDISAQALTLAQQNARDLKVDDRIRFLREDLFKAQEAAAPWADMIVSNPPYVPTRELAALDPEVRKEPALALDGGLDGLSAIRAIARAAPIRLKIGGWIALEIGAGQGRAVREILRAHFDAVELRKDLQGLERYVLARCSAR